MKILASPFESPRESSIADAAESSRLREIEPESILSAPAAALELQPSLDQSTRESLARLSLLIRGQMKLVAPIKSSEDSESDSPKKPRDDDDEGDSDGLGDNNRKAASAISELEAAHLMLAQETFPKLVELELRLNLEARKRGVKIYSQQKNKDAVRMILDELEKRNLKS